MGYDDQTHAELAELLKERGMDVPKTKQERIDALTEADASSPFLHRVQERYPWATVPVIAVVVMLVVGGGVTAILFGDAILGWFSDDEFDGELIDFDPTQTRIFAEGLLALGHPEWEGRMSGTAEEHATAQSNLNNFTDFGLSAEDNSYAVPMFEIQDEPVVRICIPGSIPVFSNIAPCSAADVNRQEIEIIHREEFVLQGYSGSADYQFQDNIPVVDLGNASDEGAWENASASIGLVFGQGGVSSNTQLFLKAQQSDLYGLIIVTWDSTGGENTPNNCKLPGEDGRCIPYFKSVDTSQFESLPPGIPFMMVDNQVGELIRDEVVNGEGRISMNVQVDNQGERDVKAPCGILPGKTDELIIFGAHHDTVYNAAGAVDDTSGTATVLELARQFANMAESKGEPHYTLKFCTWGGEEEGLHGSKAFVAAYLGQLQENLRLYVNLDMNHVDIDLENRGNALWMFGNDARDMKYINQIVERFEEENPQGLASKYVIHTDTLDGEKGSSNAMPYNSDHAPFVYDLQQEEGDERGRAVVCYGSGSWEYHTYKDTMDRFNEDSLAVSGIIYGSYAAWLAWG
jgi:hypothetical protein